MAWNLEEAIRYYHTLGAPKDQSALVGLLREIQSEHGGSIPKTVLGRIGEAYQIKDSFLLAVIRRIPSLRLSDAHTLEICAGPNCGKHTELAAYAEKLQKEKGFALKFTPCMRLCGKGPNICWDGKLYHRADEALLRQLTEE